MKCPLCQSEELEEGNETTVGYHETVRWYVCKDCGTEFGIVVK
jgi:transposase-like protein